MKLNHIAAGIAYSALIVASTGAITAVAAPASGVTFLLKQAEFWSDKGRNDLALAAYKRVNALDPTNAEARAAIAKAEQGGPGPQPDPVGAPKRAPDPASHVAATRSKSARVAAPHDPSGAKRAAGFAALDRGDLAAAAADFRAALANQASDADSLGGLGVVYLRQGQFDQARANLDKALRLGAEKWKDADKSADFYGQLKDARALLNQGDANGAERDAQALVKAGDDTTLSANRLLADALFAQGQFGPAASLYSSLADRLHGPDSDILRVSAVRAAAKQAAAEGRTDAAIQLLQQAIVSNLKSPWLNHDYAELLLSQDRKADALAAIAPIESDDTPEAIYASSLILVEAGKPEVADQRLSRLAPEQMDPALRQLAVNVKVSEAVDRAKSLYKAGRAAEAFAELQSLSERDISRPAVSGDLALAYLNLNRPDRATDLALRGASEDQSDVLGYSSVVLALARTGQDTAAAGLIDRLEKENGASPALARLRALYASAAADRLRQQGQLATAFDLLQAAWKTAPGDQDLLGATARLYETGRMYIQAGQTYELILQKHPDDTAAWLGLARAASLSNSPALMHKALARAVQADAANPETYEAAATIADQMGDRRTAVEYLKKARTLIARQSQLADGAAFPAANPFSNAASPRLDDGTHAWGMVNPFLLASTRSQTLDGAPAASGASLDSDFMAAGSSPNAIVSMQQHDAALTGLDQQLDALQAANSPNASANVQVRTRSGESGLSELNEVQATLRYQGSLGDVAFGLTAKPTVLEAGSLDASALARYGTNATAEAQGIVAREPSLLTGPSTQRNAGVSVGTDLAVGGFKADFGSTPLGLERMNLQGGLSLDQKISPNATLTVSVARRPVDDSITSYGGSRDPVTGKVWGGVMKDQATVGLAYDKDGAGIYAQANGRDYQGFNVKSNSAAEVNAGAYFTLLKTGSTSLTFGTNVNFQGYANNQDFFTFGHGGYFSPQDFAAVSLPISLRSTLGKWALALNVAPGYQNFDEASAPVYPTLHADQALLNSLKAQDNDVRASYDSMGKNGFAISGGATADYPITSSAKLDIGVSYNSFGPFSEIQSTVGFKQALGGDGK